MNDDIEDNALSMGSYEPIRSSSPIVAVLAWTAGIVGLYVYFAVAFVLINAAFALFPVNVTIALLGAVAALFYGGLTYWWVRDNWRRRHQ